MDRLLFLVFFGGCVTMQHLGFRFMLWIFGGFRLLPVRSGHCLWLRVGAVADFLGIGSASQ